MKFFDIHTHKQVESIVTCVAIVNLHIAADETVRFLPDRYYSCGIHPWHLQEREKQMVLLREVLSSPSVLAIGEAGLDKLADIPMSVQIDVFREQAVLAEEYRKPLIIHCVKAWDALIAIRKKIKPQMQWIIHGFRGNQLLAAQLIAQGFDLSFGKHFNPEALAVAYPHGLLAETDEADMAIQNVYSQLSASLDLPVETFATLLEQKAVEVFPTLRM